MSARLPELPAATQPETAPERGARCLRWILETRITATVASVDLERADSAAIEAGCSPDMTEPARANLSEMRHAIAATLRIRRELDKTAGAAVAGCQQATRANLGPMAPLQAPPTVRPLAPVEVEINF